jgi:hypothetical protein
MLVFMPHLRGALHYMHTNNVEPLVFVYPCREVGIAGNMVERDKLRFLFVNKSICVYVYCI